MQPAVADAAAQGGVARSDGAGMGDAELLGMKSMQSDELVTVMGGALGGAVNPSWIKPLPNLFGSTAPKWQLPKTPAAAAAGTTTSWL